MLNGFKRIILLPCALFLTSVAAAPPNHQQEEQNPHFDSLVQVVEGQLLLMDFDSARSVISSLDLSADYVLALSAITDYEANYKQLSSFIESVIKQPNTEALEVDRFLAKNLKAPERFDLDYVWESGGRLKMPATDSWM